MKKLLIITLSFLLFSCKEPIELFDTLKDSDKTIAKVLSYELVENKYLKIRFDSPVELVEFQVDKTDYERFGIGNELFLSLPYPLSYGEEAVVSLTVKKESGNKTRASFILQGFNERLPGMVINELSTDGSSSSPDRVELYMLTEGNTAGALLTDTLDECVFSLPPIEVFQGDIIVVYWDKPKREDDYTRQSGKTIFLEANANKTINSKNGVFILKESRHGDIVDALIYSDSECEKFSAKAKADAEYLIANGYWSGDAIDSTYVTSSRVIARRPGAVDTDSADDFFITAPRRSSFGEENIYAPYIPNEFQ